MEKLLKTNDINDLILYMKSRTDLDLAKYRPTTLRRRISHRMMVRGFSDAGEYISCVYSDPSELESLTEEITIKVTEFFRDSEVFRYLERKVIPQVVAEKLDSGDSSFTVWSAGCSTGEEAYSLAMLIAGGLRGTGIRARILGTDLSAEACRLASRGEYAGEKVLKIPDELRDRYISRKDGLFSISDHIRKMVSFRVHNIFAPPPMRIVDMVVCRNVIIHFKHLHREEVLGNFHSVLPAKGFLLLGKSEAVSGSAHRSFKIVSPSIKLYRKSSG